MSTTNELPIKTATTRELAAMYGVSAKTLRSWLRPHQPAIGERRSRYYTARQLRIIFEKLGAP